VRVLGKERDFVALCQPHFTFAFITLERGGGNEPNPLFDDQVAAVLTFKREIDVPQSG
jgi:hypothetical protein